MSFITKGNHGLGVAFSCHVSSVLFIWSNFVQSLYEYFETMKISYYSSNSHPLILAPIDNSCPEQLLLWLPNGGLSMIRKSFCFSTVCLGPCGLVYIFFFYSMDYKLYYMYLYLYYMRLYFTTGYL